MNKHKDILIVLGVSALLIGAVIFATTPKGGAPGQTAFVGNLLASGGEGGWVEGNPTSSVALVEYSDFQCPACAAYYPIVKRLMSEFGDRVSLTYRHFPLRDKHESADLAARATEAAGIQGKFWAMHDMIFENQARWALLPGTAEAAFINYAKVIGLDIDRFKADLNSAVVRDKVEKDYQSGLASGIDHTPTFFLNGKEIPNPQSYEDFRSTLLRALGEQP